MAETGSTNADLLTRLREGEAIDEQFWLRAVSQISGRGRLGRTWQSMPGNLFCSTIVDCLVADPLPHTLSFVAALAVHDTLAQNLPETAPFRLKWPNDAEVAGAKIAGILLERHENNVVVGIGINITHAPEIMDRDTTSLVSENVSFDGDAEVVLASLADNFQTRLAEWRRDGLAVTIAAWAARAHSSGERLAASNPDGTKTTGTYAGIANDGALRLRLPDGSLTQIYAGDIAPA